MTPRKPSADAGAFASGISETGGHREEALAATGFGAAGVTTHSLDTDEETARRQVEAWRAMTPAEKLVLVRAMNEAVRQLALAGVRQRHPDASPREQFLRLAIVMLGADLARKAYPEIDFSRPGVTEPGDPIDIALAVVHTLDALGITSTIGGSIASSIAGEPRSTIDIDIVAAIEGAARQCARSCALSPISMSIPRAWNGRSESVETPT